MFYRENKKHDLDEFKGKEPTDAASQIYTWADATLRELGKSAFYKSGRSS